MTVSSLEDYEEAATKRDMNPQNAPQLELPIAT